MTISQTAADQRLISAREFLAGARKRRVGELPPSLLMRECAELRRQLGQVLDVVDGVAGALGLALADAITHREPTGYCLDCVEHPSGLCCDHAADLDRCDDYLHLAAELGIQVGAEPGLPSDDLDDGMDDRFDGPDDRCPDCGRSSCTGEGCYWPDEAGIERPEPDGDR